MHLKLTFFAYLLIVISLRVSNVNGLRCYICGEDDDTLDSNNSCQNFDTAKDTYAKECDPSNNLACETAFRGNKVIKRKCINKNLHQCMGANKEMYCFCTTDLCNGEVSHNFLSPTDDEDLMEGSGTKTITFATENPKITDKINSTGAKIHVSHFICFISFIIFTITK